MEKMPLGGNEQNLEQGPVKDLEYVIHLAQRIEENVNMVLAMVEEAKEKSIPIDLENNMMLKNFVVGGKYEVELLNINSDIMAIQGHLLNQGVVMTGEDLRSRLEKMGK
ncbi:MAG: hypothetical protein NTV62_01960 [Candidatus Gribaldobacteria bacterium]|nr:hypothetical protein [Candidatus Gribaldobacteria bacterium]